MTNEWIIDVLTDLKSFAEMNGLKATATGLDDVALVALAELSGMDVLGQAGDDAMVRTGHEQPAGNVTQLFAGRGLT